MKRAALAIVAAAVALLGPTTALAWRRLLRSDDPAELQAFAEAWLGRGVGVRN